MILSMTAALRLPYRPAIISHIEVAPRFEIASSCTKSQQSQHHQRPNHHTGGCSLTLLLHPSAFLELGLAPSRRNLRCFLNDPQPIHPDVRCVQRDPCSMQSNESRRYHYKLFYLTFGPPDTSGSSRDALYSLARPPVNSIHCPLLADVVSTHAVDPRPAQKHDHDSPTSGILSSHCFSGSHLHLTKAINMAWLEG